MALRILMTDDGDWSLNPNGELTITSDLEYVLQEIQHVLRSSPGDYTLTPTKGFNMSYYLSKPNTEANINDLKRELADALSEIDGIQNYQMVIDAYPIDIDKIKLEIILTTGDSISYTIGTKLVFGSGGTSGYGYVIKDHTPYKTSGARPIAEVIKVRAARSTIELSNLPINNKVELYDFAGFVPIVNNEIDTALENIVLSGHITLPSGVIGVDVSGNDIIGLFASRQFIIDTDWDGIPRCYATVNQEQLECEFVDSSPSFLDYMLYVTALSGTVSGTSDVGEIVSKSPDITVDKNYFTTPEMMSDFDLALVYNNMFAEAISIKESKVELDKHSIGYFGRADKKWTAGLSRQLPSGTYLAVYTTFEYQ